MTSTPATPEPAPEGAPKAVDASENTGPEPGEVQQSSPEKSSAATPFDSADSASSRASPPPAKPTQTETEAAPAAPPLPDEPVPGTESNTPSEDGPPLPKEPVPEPEDDGWEAHWNPNTNSFWFYNRFTGVWQQENPRVPDATAAAVTAPVVVPETADKSAISNPVSVAGGYNPAIHGDYDPNAWYAQNARAVTEPAAAATAVGIPAVGEAGAEYATSAHFNRWTGQWQAPEQGVERHTDEAKSRRQMNAYFDVDAAANMHDGRSLKAERAGKKPTKAELKMFKEKRKAKKEEKRRAWLRD
ncbi:hypothetical protein QBC34DRAFT_14604 [Podospora aff. communis PSN243]|uniref:WW domain-containing protein n=1 Tax=Podospora aff. communis PSN243 TaxID=3040156 RepID=A0AAV9H7N1_9PEZI|nr:hypothetical protein QBC34DRAFT_14604 [Podospora aff. communis PSN243]